MNSQKETNNQEQKTFEIKMDKVFYKEVGKDQVIEQLKTQVYAYFQNVNWYITEALAEEKDGKITLTIHTTGKKGLIKSFKDEAEQEKKST